MDMGVYLSPWDAHSPLYHVDREADYNAYYLAQLKEILSNPAYGNVGKFAEVCMVSLIRMRFKSLRFKLARLKKG